MPSSVGIIGAGIGGLTAATALRQKGFIVRVYEQASHFIPNAGAGFGFSPNGQVCLKSIGIETRQLIHPFDKLVHLNKKGIPTQESHFFQEMRKRHGFGMGGCLRADLVDALKDSLNDQDDILQYSHKLVHMTQNDERVCLHFEDGKQQEHDFVIGADGIHSCVAQLLEIDDSPPIYSDANIFYGVIEEPDEAMLREIGLEPHAVVQGNNIGEFITFPAGKEQTVQVWAATYPSSKAPPRDEWGVVEPSSDDLQAILDQFAPTHPIHALASCTTPDRLLHFGLFYRKHKDQWHKGRTVLLGDSCHATLPYVGQGANQAIEDAIVLTDCLTTKQQNYNAAFESYYQQRNKRTRRIVNMASIMNKLHHTQNPILIKGRDFLFSRILQGKTMLRMLEKEIVEECPVKDYAKYR